MKKGNVYNFHDIIISKCRDNQARSKFVMVQTIIGDGLKIHWHRPTGVQKKTLSVLEIAFRTFWKSLSLHLFNLKN